MNRFVVDDDLIRRALAEDLGRGDLTTDFLVPEILQGEGRFTAREDFILAGRPICERCFTLLDPELIFYWDARDGQTIRHGGMLARVEGRARSMLSESPHSPIDSFSW